MNTFQSDLPVLQRLEAFIDYYFKILIENPIIPLFILQELTSNPNRLINTLKNGGFSTVFILKSISEEMERGNIRQMDPKEVMVNLMSLIIFPFVARPLFEEMIFSGDKDGYTAFLQQRKDSLKRTFIQSVKP
jgi:hypothetical protein